jgi:hypothetical protein
MAVKLRSSHGVNIFPTIALPEIARMMPDRAVQEKVLASTREFLLRSF